MKHIAILVSVMTMVVSCGGRSIKGAPSVNEPVSKAESASNSDVITAAPKEYTYSVKKILPHDTKAYTQGLLWHDGYLYEGTGQYGASELRKVDLATGKVVQSTKLERKYFGEGIVLLDGLIYQLTWLEGRAFVYDADKLRLVRSFSYDGEGWGITTDGKKLYMSNGTDVIYVRDPATFAVERTMKVKNGRNRVRYINELEWIDGEIWANIYMTDQIVRIDPNSGAVTGIIDFSGLQLPSDRTFDTDVFNGIAHDESTGSIYVTGKNWNKLYEVEIIEKR